VRPLVPQLLDFIVAKTLAKDPDERYQSAKELESDLHSSLQQGAAPHAVPAASLSSGNTAVLADTALRDGLMAKTLPLERSTDALADATPPASTLGISRVFDSMAA